MEFSFSVSCQGWVTLRDKNDDTSQSWWVVGQLATPFARVVFDSPPDTRSGIRIPRKPLSTEYTKLHLSVHVPTLIGGHCFTASREPPGLGKIETVMPILLSNFQSSNNPSLKQYVSVCIRQPSLRLHSKLMIFPASRKL